MGEKVTIEMDSDDLSQLRRGGFTRFRKPRRGGGRVVRRAASTQIVATTDFLYDSVNTTATSATLFTTPISSTKSLTFTNLTQQGVLPFTESFQVKGVGAFITPQAVMFTEDAAPDAVDLQRVLNGNWKFFLGTNVIMQGNIAMVTSFTIQTQTVAPIVTAGSATFRGFIQSPFVSALGYIPLRKKERWVLKPGQDFHLDTSWETAPEATNPFFWFFVLVGTRLRAS